MARKRRHIPALPSHPEYETFNQRGNSPYDETDRYPHQHRTRSVSGRAGTGGCLKRGTYPCRRYRCIIDRATGSRQSVADRPQLLHHAAHCMGNTRSKNPIDADRRRESEIVFKRHSGKPGKLKTSDTNDKRPLEHKVQRAFVVMYFLIRKDTFHRQKQVRQPNIRAMQSMRSSSNTTRSSSFPIP